MNLAELANKTNAIAIATPRVAGSCYALIGVVLDELEKIYPATSPSMLEEYLSQAIDDRLVKATLGDLPHQRGEIWRNLAFIKIPTE